MSFYDNTGNAVSSFAASMTGGTTQTFQFTVDVTAAATLKATVTGDVSIEGRLFSGVDADYVNLETVGLSMASSASPISLLVRLTADAATTVKERNFTLRLV